MSVVDHYRLMKQVRQEESRRGRDEATACFDEAAALAAAASLELRRCSESHYQLISATGGLRIPDGFSHLAVFATVAGGLEFRWVCEHRPLASGEQPLARLGSGGCLHAWIDRWLTHRKAADNQDECRSGLH